jgi:thiol:disulfide interchange protein DsbD
MPMPKSNHPHAAPLSRLIRGLTLVAVALAAIAIVPHVAWASDGADFDKAREGGWIWAYLGAFGAGFATSLTPCVYPMIPIILGIFGARGKSVTRGKAMTLAALYVLGMGVTFATLGCVFALIGNRSGAGSLLAEPGFVIPMVALYVVLAASMFGAFELNLPASWQAKLSTVGGTGYGGAFAMGLVGGFTAAPCTGPFLGGMLGFITASGDVAMGGSLLFIYAMGMGVLFFVLAAFALALPKSGRWMDWVKSFGGVALIVVAMYFLRPIVPALRNFGDHSFGFLAIGVALTALGLGAGAIHLSFHDGPAIKARKAGAVLAAVAGLFSIVAWFVAVPRHLPWVHGNEQGADAKAFAQARAEGKGVMIDFGATWCTACTELEHTFAADGVYEGIVADFVPLKFDVTESSEANDALKANYHVQTLPAVLFIKPDGTVVGRVNDYMPADDFRAVLEPAGAAVRRPTSASR